MRKIEKSMIDAIQRNVEWCLDNTRVVPDDNGGSHVFLHGNHIAYIGDGSYVNMRTWNLWPTRTTSSRLRALQFVYDKKTRSWS